MGHNVNLSFWGYPVEMENFCRQKVLFWNKNCNKMVNFAHICAFPGIPDARKLRGHCVRNASEVSWHRGGRKDPKMVKISHLGDPLRTPVNPLWDPSVRDP